MFYFFKLSSGEAFGFTSFALSVVVCAASGTDMRSTDGDDKPSLFITLSKRFSMLSEFIAVSKLLIVKTLQFGFQFFAKPSVFAFDGVRPLSRVGCYFHERISFQNVPTKEFEFLFRHKTGNFFD